MSDAITIQIDGLEQVARALQSIPALFSTKIMRGALHAAGDVMAEEIESTAPVRTGELKADIVVKVHVGSDLSDNYAIVGPGYERGNLTVKGTRTNKRGKIEAVVDTTESPGVYGKFVEEGHRAPQHKEGRTAKEIEYGGADTPPHPFMRPAYEASRENALQTFVTFVQAGLETVTEAARQNG